MIVWDGEVHLDPPTPTDQPKYSLERAWTTRNLDRIALTPSAIYDVLLAKWTSDESMVARTATDRAVPHKGRLAWVILARHYPVEQVADPQAAKVPCYFGTMINAIDATTGSTISYALKYSR